MISDFDINAIQEEQAAREAIVMLLNIVENSKQENQELKEQIQALEDEINRSADTESDPIIFNIQS